MLVIERLISQSVLVGLMKITVNWVSRGKVCLHICEDSRPSRWHEVEPEQVIELDEDVTCMVTGLTGSGVRLGITAPASVRILRTELEDLPPPRKKSRRR